MPVDLVVVGGSAGGLEAVSAILEGLPQGFAPALAVALHRGDGEEPGPAEALQRRCVLPVREVEDKDAIEPGHVYLAPARYHLLVERGEFALSVDERVCYARPSVDALFESAADAYGGRVAGGGPSPRIDRRLAGGAMQPMMLVRKRTPVAPRRPGVDVTAVG